jgi:hypothetical protein
VFGIDPSSTRGAAAFLQVSRRILADPRHTLWVTAEGQFVDPRRRPVRLRPGISHLARHLPGVIFLPLAIEYVFWNESRPEALVRFGPAVAIHPQQETAEVTAILGSALTRTMDALADESMTRDPGLFLPLIRGRAGVGGIYDLWRRLCAWTAGRSFDPSHGAPAESGRQ